MTIHRRDNLQAATLRITDPLVLLQSVRCGLSCHSSGGLRPVLVLLQWRRPACAKAMRCGLRPLLVLLQYLPCKVLNRQNSSPSQHLKKLQLGGRTYVWLAFFSDENLDSPELAVGDRQEAHLSG